MGSGGTWCVPARILNSPIWSALTLSGVIVLRCSCFTLQVSVIVSGVIGVIVIVVPDAGVDADSVGVVGLGNGVSGLSNSVREMLFLFGGDFLAFGSYVFLGTEMTRIQLCHSIKDRMSPATAQIVTMVRWQCHNVCICQPCFRVMEIQIALGGRRRITASFVSCVIAAAMPTG
jgi:hypothetical protein